MKITYIVFQIDKAFEFEWLIQEINNQKFELSFISIHHKSDTALRTFCQENNIPFYHVDYHSKKDLIRAIFKTRKIIRTINPLMVHCHIFEGGLIGITAAWLARIKHRIYTRHYSDYHHVYAPSGLKFDKWINKRSTHIIAVSGIVKTILEQKERVPASKLSTIPHGINNLHQYSGNLEERVNHVKAKYLIPNNRKIIGVISRYTNLKGIQHILPAIKQLMEKHSNLHLVLANARGDMQEEIHKLLQTLPKNCYTEITFEKDNEALFHCFNYFVHVPISREAEAFGLIYLEAMRYGIPCVFTLSGIANELVEDEKNALVVPYENPIAIQEALERLMNHPELCQQLVQNAKEKVKGMTSLEKTKKLEALYLQLASNKKISL